MSTLKQRGRGIILMHDIHPSTAAAVPELLKRLNAEGYKVVHLRPISPVQTLAGFEPPSKEIGHGHSVRRVRIHAKRVSQSKWLMW